MCANSSSSNVILAVCQVAAAEWPALFNRFLDSSFEQSATYAAAAARRIKGRVVYMAVCRGDSTVAAAAIRIRTIPLLGRGIAWCPSGPLITPTDGRTPDTGALVAVLSALRHEVAIRQGHILRLRLPGTAFLEDEMALSAAAQAGFDPAGGERGGYTSAVLDLSQDTETLMSRLTGKWRTDLRAAWKVGLEFERGNSQEMQVRFLALFDRVQAAKGFHTEITPHFHFDLSEGPDYAVEILIATHNGQDVAGIVIGHGGATSTYLFGATIPAGRPLRAGYFLTWEALAIARERGAHWYDLGGIDAEANPDVARFKLRMNGRQFTTTPFEARGPGAVPRLVVGLEALHARLRHQRKWTSSARSGGGISRL